MKSFYEFIIIALSHITKIHARILSPCYSRAGSMSALRSFTMRTWSGDGPLLHAYKEKQHFDSDLIVLIYGEDMHSLSMNAEALSILNRT